MPASRIAAIAKLAVIYPENSFAIVLYRCRQIFLDAVQTDADVAFRNAHNVSNLAIRETFQVQNYQGPLRRRQRADRGMKMLSEGPSGSGPTVR